MSEHEDPKSPPSPPETPPEPAASPPASEQSPGAVEPLSAAPGPDLPPAVTFVEDIADPTEVWKQEGGTPRVSPPGRPRIGTGDPSKLHCGRRMTQELYDSIWEAWRDGNRNKSRLAQMFTVSYQTLNRVITKGYPDKGWPAIEIKYQEWERQELSAKRQAQAVAEAINSDEYLKARQDNLNLIKVQKVALAQVVRKSVEAAQKAKFTKTKRVRDKTGAMVDIEVEPSAFEMADAMKTLIAAAKELGQYESFWLGGPDSRTETSIAMIGQPPKGWAQLPPEVLDWISEHHGDLPPGLTQEMLDQGVPQHVLDSLKLPASTGPKN